MSARLHIDRVVLHGIALGAGQRQQFQAALEAQLGALLAQQPLSPRPVTQERLAAAPVALGRATMADDGARAVATSLLGCLRP
ncbi:hypothetical protein [Stenotrophomonas sp.]|uniref:hypothetical protein n=1 Tax=Stenotrophomonas sp. TaxID=69392 RepID=UPI0028AEF785|nr:hypothetical protein [Stenotrophomonas sp.]